MKNLKVNYIISSIIIGMTILIIGYFLALNNRYLKLDDRYFLDKWTQKIYSKHGDFIKKLN